MSCIEISCLGFNTTFVTVLLDAAQELQWDLAEFQYNFCYCSMHKTNHPNTKHYWFQYNFCYCSMRITAPSTYWSGSFQYNFCYCSILQSVIFLLSQVQVSIQLLLLFYNSFSQSSRGIRCVSIQLLLLFYLA